MRKAGAFLGFLVTLVLMVFVYITMLPGNEIIRTLLGIILFVACVCCFGVFISEPSKEKKRRRR